VIILDQALAQRAADGNPVRIAVVGAGYMGRGIADQIVAIPGLELVAMANRSVERAVGVLAELGGRAVERVRTVAELEDAIVRRQRVVTEDASIVCEAEGIDVVLEATGEVEFGARVATHAMAHGKHVVLVNAELDATVGPILKAVADEAEVVITNTDGDEPGVTMNLLRYVRTIGMKPVLVGNIKGFIDPHRNPETQAAFAESVGQGAKMITSFADGTKLSMEATIVANASGFRVARRGMNGFRCEHVNDVLGFFEPEELLSGGMVDYVLGAQPGSGAFVVGHTERPVSAQYLKYFKMGDGPFYVFYTPWHLPHAEAPLTCARAALFNDASVAPLGAPRCDVVAVAKRDLRESETLDGIGGFDCYGVIENCDTSYAEALLPMGLAEGCRLTRDVALDEPITYEDVVRPAGRPVDRLRAEQDQRFGGPFSVDADRKTAAKPARP
jgi:predicted homoserine dehydrogenase-like protein